MEVGGRIGAVLKMDAETVHLLGYGIYEGDHEPPFGPLGFSKAEHDKVVTEMKADGRLPADYVWVNPRLLLDDGRIVWGAQCWWGGEEAVRRQIGERTVVHAEIHANQDGVG